MNLGKIAIKNRIKKIKELQEERDRISLEIDALKKEIKDTMDSLSITEWYIDEYILRYNTKVRTELDRKMLKEKYEAIYNECLTSSSYRPLRIDKNTVTAERTA